MEIKINLMYIFLNIFMGLFFGSFIYFIVYILKYKKSPNNDQYKPYSPIYAIKLIPILSNLDTLCRPRIIIEVLTALITVLLAIIFGFSTKFIVILLLSYQLIILSCIDIEHMLIPLEVCISIIFSGICISYFNILISFKTALIGILIIFVILWSINKILLLVNKNVVIGFGDIVLLSAISTWVNWHNIPFILLVASIFSFIYSLARNKKKIKVPFAPFISMSTMYTIIANAI